MTKPDPKPRKRHRANGEEWASLYLDFRQRGNYCQMCGDNLWSDLHHVVPRAQGGDDFKENLIPLCRDCHVGVTDNKMSYLMLLRWSLSQEHKKYVRQRKGEEWLKMKYPAVMIK